MVYQLYIFDSAGSGFGGLLEYTAWKSNGLPQCPMFQHTSGYHPTFLPVSAGIYTYFIFSIPIKLINFIWCSYAVFLSLLIANE